jgi:hypothetical protein
MFKNTLSVEKEYHILSLGSFIYFQEFLTAEVLEIRKIAKKGKGISLIL